MASAYATVAADGRYAAPYTVARITRDGRTVYRARPDVRRALGEREATLAGARMGAGRTSAADGSAESEVFTTGGAGGGTTRRTVWSTGYDGRLALTVALFADRPGGRKGTTVPAQLPNVPSPTEFAQSAAAGIWEAATKSVPESAGKR
ncbi:hypothetical protein ABZ915_36675 [Streptomyces sp. NPDC046915]|uniref:hypothetical protein n=1 Tax=Streptomyces sp. NPDC046915 TaxID=3155257 RepID=UPI0033CC54E5